MPFKLILATLGCLIAWTVLLPIVFIGGGALLFLYSALIEISILFTGVAEQRISPSTARELALSMCLGFGRVPARAVAGLRR